MTIPVMTAVLAALVLALPGAAAAQELPQFPKVSHPGSLPEPICDAARADAGDWLVGKWVAPLARWEFVRQGNALTWVLDQKGAIDIGQGWRDGARLDGPVGPLSACTVGLSGGDGRFSAQGVLTETGRLFLIATNPQGAEVRYLLRRER